MRYLLYLALFAALSSFTLKEKIARSHSGDYIVTEQSNNVSVLVVRSVTENKLILEEITTPSDGANTAKISWKAWVESRAPGATSWSIYEIDLPHSKLTRSYSHLQKKWIKLDDSEYFFAKLLSLPLKKMPPSERKKIGPTPTGEERDYRKIWNPPQFVDGKKVDKPTFEVFKGVWGEDHSPLSRCPIELYFDQANPSFPFPYWMEVKSPHYAFKIRVIDSGTGLNPPTKNVLE